MRFPAQSNTTIVSPMTRPNPSKIAGDYSGERSRNEDAADGLEAIRAERVGGFLEAARHVP